MREAGANGMALDPRGRLLIADSGTSVRDTTTAYGARLTAKGTPANLNANRVNNRVNSRIGNRLSLRIERYRPDAANPTAAFQTTQEDRARPAPVIAPLRSIPNK